MHHMDVQPSPLDFERARSSRPYGSTLMPLKFNGALVPHSKSRPRPYSERTRAYSASTSDRVHRLSHPNALTPSILSFLDRPLMLFSHYVYASTAVVLAYSKLFMLFDPRPPSEQPSAESSIKQLLDLHVQSLNRGLGDTLTLSSYMDPRFIDSTVDPQVWPC
ncbi:hypothetical protein B0H16DRAFT_1729624 [Mycena metata]|uniref:Uncharacterized protein n=1 Tax=Mycena metata TaxID=1033252 RepID=A0AAD7IAV5_9AGAR|nr:hypothetical protein B0H16DRAFT_1729624 [Mycena metata]